MHSNFIDTVCYTDKYAVIIHYPLYDTAMIICKGGPKTVRESIRVGVSAAR